MRRAASKRISQKDIAEKLGLSRATVANILSPNSKLPYSAETRARVLKAAKEMGYQVNRASRAIRTGQSNLIGVIHFGGGTSLPGPLSVAVPQAVSSEGYDSLVLDFRWHGGNIERVLQEMIQARVEGAVICLSVESFTAEHVAVLERAGIPCVTVYGDDRLGIPLFSDNAASTYCALAHHLIATGHRNLVLLANKTNSRWNRERIAGFRAAMEPYGPLRFFSAEAFLKENVADRKEHSQRGIQGIQGMRASVVELDFKQYGYDPALTNFEFGKQLFGQRGWKGALLCFNDDAAYGLCNAAYLRGYKVPDDVAITGFDDRKYSSLPMFDLTTISTDVAAASNAAVGALSAFLKGTSSSIESRTFDSNLVLRGSCGRPRGKRDEAPPQVIPIPYDYHTDHTDHDDHEKHGALRAAPFSKS